MLKSTTKSKVVSVNPAALLRFVGVDTSQDTLDAADSAGHTRSVLDGRASVEVLVDINTAVMRGLRGDGGGS